MHAITRLTTLGDVPLVEELCDRLYGAKPNVARLIETSLLCLTAIDGNAVIGFLCLDDAASVRLGSKCPDALPWIQQQPAASAANSAFVSVAAFLPEHEVEASTALLRAAFLTVTFLQTLLLATDNDITFSEPGLGGAFNRVGFGCSCYLYEGPRATAVPPLMIRRARVEDHDDMVPIMESSGAQFPALAKLPQNCRPEETFALTRLVANQDEGNCVLVAIMDKQLVGFMVVTSEVDASSLLDTFDLHPYDNFLPVERYETQYKAAKDSIHSKKKLHSNKKTKNATTETEDMEAEEEEEGEEDQEGSGEQQDVGELSFDLEPAARPSEEEIRQEMLSMFPGGASDQYEDESTVFAITMMCMADGCEAQASEFLQHAFNAFPNKDYCVVTLPHESAEPALMASMTRLPPLPGASFPEVLYLFNRNALLEGFEVRSAQVRDVEGVSKLVEGMPNGEDIIGAFKSALDRSNAVVASCQGEVVGVVTISSTVDLKVLQDGFSLISLVAMEHHAVTGHGEIDIYVMNPIFAHRHRELLSGTQRLLKRTCLYYALPPGQPSPDMIEVLQQVPPRHRQATAGDVQTEFSLYVFTRRGGFYRKKTVNAQIVVVGASECGLSTIESLLLDQHLAYNYLTLLAPGGISVGGPACEYTAGVVARLGLEARVTILDAELVGLDTQQRTVQIHGEAGESQLPYDLLLVTSGLQEQTRGHVGEKDPEAAAVVFNALELGAEFATSDTSALGHIVIYGDTLDSYHAMSILERSGAAGGHERAGFYAPPSDGRDPFVEVLMKCAQRVRLELPQPKAMELKGLHSIEGTSRPHAYFEGPSDSEDMLVDLVIGCRPHDVSPWVFSSLNGSGIVYDGRIVVDCAFRTNDPNIYAAGTAAKLSRRYGHRVSFESYNSKECGVKLSESVSSLFLGTQAPDSVMPLRASRVVGCDVPGDKMFLFAGVPTAMMAPSLQPPPGGVSLSTSSAGGLMHICLDARKRVHSIAYLGLKEMQASKVANLVGLHSAYLNNLQTNFEAGLVPDLVEFLNQPWAEILHYDSFRELRSELLARALSASEGGMAAVGPHVLNAALQHLRLRSSELPAYRAGIGMIKETLGFIQTQARA